MIGAEPECYCLPGILQWSSEYAGCVKTILGTVSFWELTKTRELRWNLTMHSHQVYLLFT